MSPIVAKILAGLIIIAGIWLIYKIMTYKPKYYKDERTPEEKLAAQIHRDAISREVWFGNKNRRK
ncbi:MAG: hypothetical protein GYA87_00055 [Christensenellaceae bacterium]|nr:hypothetical protein [Christensenellaceae bacterium]